ncbi:MAG: PA14 domain-containing protein [Phycisphaerales bacterium]|jgi:hypothetical protein|nr:PA14 domain-containing protein [Phycisphaerales bacterium]
MNRLLAVLSVAALAGSALATSVNVPSSTRLGNVPATPGTGLVAMGYRTTTSVNTLAEARQTIATKPTLVNFTAMKFDYNNLHETNTVGNWVGSPDNTPLTTAQKNAIGDWMAYKFTGAIAIPTAGQYDFKITSDDGFEMKIGNQSIAKFDGERGSATTNGWATFTQRGLYPIEIVYFNAAVKGELKIEYKRAGTSDPFVLLAKPNLYIPTPGAAALLGLGGLVAARRRRA